MQFKPDVLNFTVTNCSGVPAECHSQSILNLATGGKWDGPKKGDDENLPARMEIDHVRVYQRAE